MGPNGQFLTAIVVLVAGGFILKSIDMAGVASEQTAAWVQAIGSIAAIVGAAWIARQQGLEAKLRDEENRRHQTEQVLAAARSRQRAVIGIADMAAQVMVNVYVDTRDEGWKESPALEGRREALTDCIDAIDRFAIETIENEEAIHSFLNMPVHLECVESALECIAGNVDTDKEFEELLENLRLDVCAGLAELNDLHKALGFPPHRHGELGPPAKKARRPRNRTKKRVGGRDRD